ncbi:MAG: VWA domain-containing protein, partial [Desulfobacterales bacterium]|nr:VWA domain-containing protein [Desulfobacterales bacterium]
TEIGSSLMQLYSEHLGSGSAHRAVVIIVSDGWDRGSPEILNEAMGLIHQRCRHLFWLNPLLSTQSYEPVCTGMRTALPYIDSFLPFDSLDSLVHLCQKIETIW